MTRPWWYRHRKFRSKQVAQSCINLPIVTWEHNYTAGGKYSLCFLKATLHVHCQHQKLHCPPEIQQQVMTSGVNSDGNVYLKSSCSHPSPEPCPRENSFCIKANGHSKILSIWRRQVHHCQVYDKKNPLLCPLLCGLAEELFVLLFKCTAIYIRSLHAMAI